MILLLLIMPYIEEIVHIFFSLNFVQVKPEGSQKEKKSKKIKMDKDAEGEAELK